jgi:hypothetical protein
MREQEKNFGKGMFIFTRGLRHLLHHCVALTGFCKKERKKEKNTRGFHFYEGLTPPSLSLFRPSGFNVSQPSQPSQPSKPSQLSQPSQPSQPSSITFCFPSKFHSSFPDWLIHF